MAVYLADVDVVSIGSNALATIGVAAVIAVCGWVVTSWRTNRRRDAKIDRILALFEGEPADPLAGRPATLGVLGQIHELSVRVTRLEAAVNAQGGRPYEP